MKNKILLSLLSLLSLLALMALSSCSLNGKVIGLKQNIHHDDFEYSVKSVEKADSIGSLKAKGTFYIVTFSVENNAKKVRHAWENNIAFVVDEKETEYESSPEALERLSIARVFMPSTKHVTGAGQTESTYLVFDIPKEVKEPYLKVRGDFLMGDLFDGNQFKNTKIKLF